jgi:hypothetical protein
MLRIQIRIGVKRLAGHDVTLPAMRKALFCTADGDRAFSVKRMPHGFDAASAVVRFLEGAARAVKAAARIDHGISPLV